MVRSGIEGRRGVERLTMNSKATWVWISVKTADPKEDGCQGGIADTNSKTETKVALMLQVIGSSCRW
jgi:hypothetical protein